MDSFKIILTILLATTVPNIQCIPQNPMEQEINDSLLQNEAGLLKNPILNTKLRLIGNIQNPETNYSVENAYELLQETQNHNYKLQRNTPIHKVKKVNNKRVRIRTKIPPDYLIPPHSFEKFYNFKPEKPEVIEIHDTTTPLENYKSGTLMNHQEESISELPKTRVPEDSIPVASSNFELNQLQINPNLKHYQEPLINEKYVKNINQDDVNSLNVFVNKVHANSEPEEIVLKNVKVPQVQLISEMSVSTLGTSALSDKDAQLLKLIDQIKLASSIEKSKINEKDNELLKESKQIQIGFKIPMPLASSLKGSPGIFRGHLDEGKSNERFYYEPIPFFGINHYPPGIPKELANQVRLQSDSYGPSFNPLYKEKYPGFLPVKLSHDSEYIEFPIEMYKTKFDPVPVSDNVYVNHQLGIGQKAGHIFPVKGSKSVFGYTRSSRFIGNIISH